MSKALLPKLEPLSLGDFNLDLNYFLTSDYQDAHSASRELPAIIEWVNSHLQSMTEQKLRLKAHVKTAEAQAYMDLKSGLWDTRGYEGKITETGLEHAIHLEDTVKKAQDELAIYSGWVSRLSNLIISLQAKLDLVRTSEATRRVLVADERGSED